MVDARREGDLDGVAGELEVDQVARAVAGQPAHPQLVEVVPQLLDADSQVGGGLGVGDSRVGLEVRHHVEQPDQPRRNRTHTVTSSLWPAWARSRASTSSRSDGGSSTTASAPYPAISRASRSVIPMSSVISSPS